MEWGSSHGIHLRSKSPLSRANIVQLQNDQHWTVTDGSVKGRGIGTSIYMTRNNTPYIARLCRVTQGERQMTRLPCDVWFLSIAVATSHCRSFLIQSEHKACILIWSKLCGPAFGKFCQGVFTVCPHSCKWEVHSTSCLDFQMSFQDFDLSYANDCVEPTCQICTFIRRTDDSVIRNISVSDILSRHVKLPFTSRGA